MKAETIHPRELDAGLIAEWRRIRGEHAFLRSPFYAPEFTQAVGTAREDARVAVFSDAGRVIGLLPHHIVRPGLAKPIGGQINDFQGPIAATDALPCVQAMLKAAHIDAYDFNHVPQAMTTLAEQSYETAESPLMDLAGGYKTYLERLDKSGARMVKETERRIRKMTREIGPVRFTRNDLTEETWSWLVEMKNDSYDRKGTKHLLDIAWVAKTLAQLRSYDTPEFAGLLSTLHAGDRLVAAHFGMRSSGVWHWWINAFDYSLGNLAPGLVQILEAAKVAEAEGVDTIDFGRGSQYFKRAFSTGAIQLCEGSIERPMLPCGMLRKTQKFAIRTASHVADERWRALAKRATRKLVGTGMQLPIVTTPAVVANGAKDRASLPSASAPVS